MAVTKRTRFEVLRRDDYTCRYCRSKDGALTIDHVVPSALGGSDDPGNLVACCRDCNSGKSSTTPDTTTVADVDADAVRWARARARAVDADRNRRQQAADARGPFLKVWQSWDSDCSALPADWRQSVDSWLAAGMDTDRILDALDIALAANYVPARSVFRYMAGVLNNWIRRLDEETRAQLEAEDAPVDDEGDKSAFADGRRLGQMEGYELGWDDHLAGNPHYYRGED